MTEADIRARLRWAVRDEIRLTFQPRGRRGVATVNPIILNRIRVLRQQHTASIERVRFAAAAGLRAMREAA